MIRFCSILLLLLFSFSYSPAASPLDSLAITVAGESREFAFTNKESAFYYGQTQAPNSSGWNGFHVMGIEFVDDYALVVNGTPLRREDVIKTVVFPDYLERHYAGGLREELRVYDSLAAFSVVFHASRPVELDVVPLFTDVTRMDDAMLRTQPGTAMFARKNHLGRSGFPAWLSVYSEPALPVKKESRTGNQQSFFTLTAPARRTHVVTFAVGKNAESSVELAKQCASNREQLSFKRRTRMEQLLNDTHVQTDNIRFNNALAWAKISLDALIMNQGAKGIFAGLPWFNDYWGRDTFISLPGAALVTGQFGLARQILRSFAAYQNRDSSDSNYGRIPNRVTTTGISYNTADGTPRFINMALEYVLRSGDTTFLYEIYPAVIRSIEGTIRWHTDSLGFLTHDDADTWMDAVGPDGPWTPRGNRANDIQALWHEQLSAGEFIATHLGDVTHAREWRELRTRLQQNFTRFFISSTGVADHLNPDGSSDGQIRPNQIFTSPLLSLEQRAEVLREVTSKLTYPYGVASLWQEDPSFHPYHRYEQYYPKDAAYHNGVVWTWLQGAVISELCAFQKPELAFQLTRNTIEQILVRGAVGTQSELLDAMTKPGRSAPELSGTFSQAWNLAEFVRNFYDDYLGAYISRFHHELRLRPRLPKELGRVTAILNLDGVALPLEIDFSSGVKRISIDARNLRVGGLCKFSIPDGDRIVESEVRLKPGTISVIEWRSDELKHYIDGAYTSALEYTSPTLIIPPSLDNLLLATPELVPDLASVKAPSYPLLPNTLVKSTNPTANTLVDIQDPIGDDTGVGSAGAYSYPLGAAFIPGCLDITGFHVSYDSSLFYFKITMRTLSNPGWHPEYGFQLTYVAIAIDTDGIPGSGRQLIPRNAEYLLPEDRAYDRIILVGGGLRVEDEVGNVLCVYTPAEEDVSNPLGNVESSTISFALPREFLGGPDTTWVFSVLVGAQDDHGGSGLGEFRSVRREAGEWNGGGRTRHDESNIYDALTARVNLEHHNKDK